MCRSFAIGPAIFASSSSLGDKTQHLYVVSPTNLQLLMESAELSLSRWRSFDGWLRPWRSCDGLPADPTGSGGPECRDFTIAKSLDCLTCPGHDFKLPNRLRQRRYRLSFFELILCSVTLLRHELERHKGVCLCVHSLLLPKKRV